MIDNSFNNERRRVKVMRFTCLFLGIAFILAGIIFAFSKIYTYIDGWKYISQEEKDNINIVPLCKNIGAIISLNGLIFLIKGIVGAFSNTIFVWVMIAWLVVAGIDLWYISKSNHYIKN